MVRKPRLTSVDGHGSPSRPDVSALRTVARVVEALELVAGGGPGLTVSEIAGRLGMPPSSAHSLVRRLSALGYLEAAAEGRRFRPGAGLVRLAIKVVDGLHVIEVARPVLARLAGQTGEDVYLAVPQADSIVYADRVEGNHSLRLSIALGDPRPLHATAAGKLYLAEQPDDRIDHLLVTGELSRYTGATITDRRRLRSELRAIRQAGIATTVEEHIEGVIGVAAPVCDASGGFVAAVTVALPRSRFLESRERLLEMVVAAAREVSRGLGWPGEQA